MSDAPGAKHLTREEQRRIEARASANDVPLVESPTPPSPEPPRERESETDKAFQAGAEWALTELHEWIGAFKIRSAAAAYAAASLPPSAETREPVSSFDHEGCAMRATWAALKAGDVHLAPGPSAPPAETREPVPADTCFIEGTWPRRCEQRAFVAGAKWWEFEKEGATMWASDQDRAAAEAVRRYGDPASAPPAGTNETHAERAIRVIGHLLLTSRTDKGALAGIVEVVRCFDPSFSRPTAPPAGSGETEPVRRRRPPDNDTHGISYGTDGVWWCEAHGEDCPMLRYLLAAHPAGTTRRQALVGCAQHTQTGFNHQCRACGAANSTPPTPEAP